jgi:acyl-CoA dehydrogenase
VFGTMRHWDDLLTDMTLHAGPDGLWALIAP